MGKVSTRQTRASTEVMDQAAEFVRRREQAEPEHVLGTLVLCAIVAASAFAVPMWISSLLDDTPAVARDGMQTQLVEPSPQTWSSPSRRVRGPRQVDDSACVQPVIVLSEPGVDGR